MIVKKDIVKNNSNKQDTVAYQKQMEHYKMQVQSHLFSRNHIEG